MMSSWLYIFIIVNSIFFTASCVSLPIGKTKMVKAEGVKFQNPGKPFQLFEQQSLDAAWKNPKNGNSISYLSDCSNETDPSMITIRQSITAGVNNLQIISEEKIEYNNRKALKSVISGNTDGVSAKFELIILKKNSCIYVLTYVGLPEHFATDQKLFSNFVRGFKAP